jgi:hypothetical protein
LIGKYDIYFQAKMDAQKQLDGLINQIEKIKISLDDLDDGHPSTDTLMMWSRMRQFSTIYTNITRQLGKHTVIAGSFPLSVILGETWYSDIDIFTSDEDFKLEYMTNPEACSQNILKSSAYNDMTGIRKVVKGTIGTNNYRIDIVYVDDVQDAINSFDLDFCKVWYDGDKIRCANWQSVLTKSHVPSSKAYKSTNWDSRKFKYMKRGFVICENSSKYPRGIAKEYDMFKRPMGNHGPPHDGSEFGDEFDSSDDIEESCDDATTQTPPDNATTKNTTGCTCALCGKLGNF